MKLNLVVDMFGCPNRCMHCWLGHMPNRKMEEGADRFIMDYFDPFFDQIAFYSWLREPDYCEDYAERWAKDLAISKNTLPERFELASFYRIVRDEKYIPFLQSLAVKKVQLTFFGLQETQDRYVGRKGAFEEVMKATEMLNSHGIIPRWQCFINEENRDEILQLYELAQGLRKNNYPALEFFVHEGSCEGENQKLYPIRIQKSHIPPALAEVYLDYSKLMTEKDCCEILKDNTASPDFPLGDEFTLNISNTYDVYYNWTHMRAPWVIGNLKKDEAESLVQRMISGDTHALLRIKECSWADLVRRFGDPRSEKVFSLDDFKMYLINLYLESPAGTSKLL